MTKRTKKESRAQLVLMRLVELYIKQGKPIGSKTLQEGGFEDLSSATIRNYFADLEKKGFLMQAHASSGRIPKDAAYRLYAAEHVESEPLKKDREALETLRVGSIRQLTTYLQRASEVLSEVTSMASFLSSVRFDHDFVQSIKLLTLDPKRLLCVLITNFGHILTEVIAIDKKLSSFALKRLESYLATRLRGGDLRESLRTDEAAFAKRLFSEIMVRYIVRYSNFSDEDIYRTGFSRLLAYKEFNDPVALAGSLALFENTSHMRLLLNDCAKGGKLRTLVGNDLAPYASAAQLTSVLAIPYKVKQMPVGSVGILGPSRMPYKRLIGVLKLFSEILTDTVTNSLYKYKLTFRTPRSGAPYIEHQERLIMDQTDIIAPQKLLESKE